MKRTIKEVYNLIEQKKENALNDLAGDKLKPYPSFKKQLRLQGEAEAYEDVLNLISTSCILTEPNEEEQFKKILWLMPITTIITSLANANEIELLEWFKDYVERRAKNDK